MKKYLIAGAAAIIVAAIAAFAASLNVNGGTLQAGSDNNLTCTQNADVVYNTSNDTNGHWIGAVELQFDAACAAKHAQIAMFGPAANQQKVYAISGPINGSGFVSIPLVNGPTRVADIINIQVMVKDPLAAGECPVEAALGNTFLSQVGATDAQIAALGKWNGSAAAPKPC